jgi:hypothetical protein
MTTSDYLLGAAELAVIAAALGLGAYHLRAWIVPGWSGAPARLAEVVLAISGLIVVAELLGVVGLLDDGWLLAGAVVVGLGAAAIARRRAPEARRPDATATNRVMLAIGAAVALLVVAHWAIPTQQSLDSGMYYQDTTWYHMSFSGRFAQEGEIGPLHFTDPLKLSAWFYPQNSELLHAVGMVSFGNDFLSPLVNLGWLALGLLAAWCVGRPFGVAATTLVGAAIVLDSEMIVGSQAGNAPNDAAGLAFLLATIALLVTGATQGRVRPIAGGAAEAAGGGVASREAPRRPQQRAAHAAKDRLVGPIGAGALLLAGLAAGLTIGTKVTALAPIGVITLGIFVLAGAGRRLREVGIFLGAMVITAGFWYGRNIAHALNPLPWVDEVGPIELPGPEQLELYPRKPLRVAAYWNDPEIWQDWFIEVFKERLGPLWFVILALMVAGFVLALWRGRGLIRMLAVTGIVTALAYFVTPLTASGIDGTPTGFEANLRYFAPAMLIGLVLLPIVPGLIRGRIAWAVLIGYLGIVALSILRPFQGSDLLNFALTWEQGHAAGAVLLALLLVGVPVAMTLLARRGAPLAAVIALPVAALALLVGLGDRQREDYLDGRYRLALAPPLEGGFRATGDWQALQKWGAGVRGLRIGVLGRGAAFGQYIFYGDDLSNHVQYIGDELSRGTFRPAPTCKVWRQKINRGNYDFVITTPRISETQYLAPPENTWTGSDPNATRILTAGPAAIFRIDGRLTPRTCVLDRPERIDPATNAVPPTSEEIAAAAATGEPPPFDYGQIPPTAEQIEQELVPETSP